MPKLKLTKTSIAALERPEGTKRVMYTDTDLPGFALRLTATGGTYYINKRDPITSEPHQVPIGSMVQLQPDEARTAARLMLRDVLVARKIKDSALSGRELMDRFIREHSVTLRNDQDADLLPRYFEPVFGRKAAAKVTRGEIIALINKIWKEDGKQTTAFHVKSRVRKMFNWAMDMQILPVSDVVRKLPNPKPGEGRYVLKKHEIIAFWRALDVEGLPWRSSAGKLLLLTGQRRAEVCEAAWEEVDLEERMWVIPGARTKNGLAQTIPLSDLALAELKKMHALTGNQTHVFWVKKRNKTLTEGVVSKDNVSSIPRKLRDGMRTKELMAGCKRFTIHNLRHTCATMVGRLTERKDIVTHILNHKDPGVTSLYDEHTYDGAKRLGYEAWEAHLKQILEL